MTNGTTVTAPWLAALWRMARTVIGYGIIYGANTLLGLLGAFHLPFWAVPIISAALNALSKWIRDKWGIDIKIA